MTATSAKFTLSAEAAAGPSRPRKSTGSKRKRVHREAPPVVSRDDKEGLPKCEDAPRKSGVRGTEFAGEPNPPELTDILALAAKDTLAEGIDWIEADSAAASIPRERVKSETLSIAACRKEFTKARALEGRGQKALAGALASVLDHASNLLNEPAVLIAISREAGIKMTKRTLASPCLPIIKLALPDLDRKVHSLYARALNYGLACSLDGAGFASAIEAHGVVELAKRETARQRIRRGERPQSKEAELLERFRGQRRPLELDEIEVPGEADFVLIIAGVLDGQFVAYDIDDDRRRLLAAVRHADRTGGRISRVQRKAA